MHVAKVTEARVTKRLEDERKAESARKVETEEQTRIRQAREKFDKASDEIADDYEGFDDFLEALNSGHTVLRDFHQAGLEHIFENDDPKVGVALAFHLENNQDVAKRIAALRPAQQVAALARLEASLPKPKSQMTQAPPPPKTGGARGGPDGKDPEKMTIEEMRKATGTRRIVRD